MTLITRPFTVPSTYFYKEKLNEKNFKEIASIGFIAFIGYITTLLPAILLEMIQFVPILFEYYLDNGINSNQFVTQLLYFNIPKLLFLIVPLLCFCFVACIRCCLTKSDSETTTLTEVMNAMCNIMHSINSHNVFEFLIGFFVYCLCFLVFPLTPVVLVLLVFTYVIFKEGTEYMTEDGQIQNKETRNTFRESLIQHKNSQDSSKKCDSYVNACLLRIIWLTLLIYILLAYGSMGMILFEDNNIGDITYAMLLTTWGLSAYMLLTPIIIPMCLLVGLASGVFCCKIKLSDDTILNEALYGVYYLLDNIFCNCCFPCKHWKYVKEELSNFKF